jgi:hypothetical protein
VAARRGIWGGGAESRAGARCGLAGSEGSGGLGVRVVSRGCSVAGRSQALDLPPFQGVAGDVGFAVMSDEDIAEVDNT